MICVVISAWSLKQRLDLEHKLTANLARALKAKGIDAQISVELNRLAVKEYPQEQDIEQFKGHVREALEIAVGELVDFERELVRYALEQPSRKGQFHYLRKLVNNSLAQLHHQQA